MYTFFRRSAAYPGLTTFDAPNAQSTETRRNRSNTPLQALTLLNDQTQTEFSRASPGSRWHGEAQPGPSASGTHLNALWLDSRMRKKRDACSRS